MGIGNSFGIIFSHSALMSIKVFDISPAFLCFENILVIFYGLDLVLLATGVLSV
jgi:hypothetical protein